MTAGPTATSSRGALARVDAARGAARRSAERNAGDELQLATSDAAAALEIALHLAARTAHGASASGSARSRRRFPPTSGPARGDGLRHARDAVERAKGATARLAVHPADAVAAEDAEAYLRLLVDLRDRRRAEGWEVADLLAEGMTQKRIAAPPGDHAHRREPAREGGGTAAGGGAVPALVRTLARLDDRSATAP